MTNPAFTKLREIYEAHEAVSRASRVYGLAGSLAAIESIRSQVDWSQEHPQLGSVELIVLEHTAEAYGLSDKQTMVVESRTMAKALKSLDTEGEAIFSKGQDLWPTLEVTTALMEKEEASTLRSKFAPELQSPTPQPFSLLHYMQN